TRVAQRAQRRGQRLIDNLEVAATRQLLELHQREVGLDAGRIAVHGQGNRAGWCDATDLGVSIAMTFAKRERAIPTIASRGEQVGRTKRLIDTHWYDRKLFILRPRRVVSDATMVPDHA